MIINKDYNRNFVPDIKIEYTTPTPLMQALKDLKEKEKLEHRICDSSLDFFIKNVAKDELLSSNKVKKYVQKGSSAIAFETPDGDILKLSIGNHFPLNRPHENFDVPIKKQGRSGKVFYYLEEKLYQHGLSEGFVEVMREKIKAEGYKPFDFYDYDIHQIGLSKDGKLYLLDPECARYKTIFHALFDKITHLLKLRK